MTKYMKDCFIAPRFEATSRRAGQPGPAMSRERLGERKAGGGGRVKDNVQEEGYATERSLTSEASVRHRGHREKNAK
jgi:hypothetical protein